MAIDHRPLILTAAMERSAFDHFQSLRLRHFPAARNQVPAHLTLFHHLPGSGQEAIATRLKQLCQGTAAPWVQVAPPRSLGRGVAYRLHSDALEELRAELAHAWESWLIPQDRAGFSPHVTVQNKVSPPEASELLRLLRREFQPWRFKVEGLMLWRYLDGPWEQLRNFRFIA